jgi:ferredoxin-NADP reductase
LERTPIRWHTATVRSITEETAGARTISLDVPEWPGHLAGQHVDVRLTAEDGYQAQRSYSIASAPEEPGIALTVELIEEGEVSPYLAGELRTGDQFEVPGPIGGHFSWRLQDGGPLLLIAGGSGLVPLMAMVRHLLANRGSVDTRLLLSSRSWESVLYREELMAANGRQGIHVHTTLTRSQPDGWRGFEGRIDAEMLTIVGPPAAERPLTFVCGPTPFVEHGADLLVALGHDPSAIHTERFGPT